MNEDEKTLEVNPDEQEKELGEGGELVTPKPSSGDEFDNLDHEALLAKAKALRAINQRHAGSGEPKMPEPAPTPAPVPQPQGKFLTVDDFRRSNRERAKAMATSILETDPEEVRLEKAEILENWNDISGYVHPDNEDTPEHLFRAIRKGYFAWRHDPYRTTPSDPTKDLKASVQKSASSKPPVADKPQTFRRKAQPMKEWYPKPEQA